jgi:hypothetical protein
LASCAVARAAKVGASWRATATQSVRMVSPESGVWVTSVVAIEVPFLHKSKMWGYDRNRSGLCCIALYAAMEGVTSPELIILFESTMIALQGENSQK